jgi:beta-lactamase class A
MKFYRLARLVFVFGMLLMACKSGNRKRQALEAFVQGPLDAVEGEVALAFCDLSSPEDVLFINADTRFHAASTMKVPVMIELFKQQAAGNFNLADTLLLQNEFRSIVDSSLYAMDISDDSADAIYNLIGTRVTLRDLMVPMITVSSNLATNVLIEKVDAKKVTQSMRDLGADSIQVLRGVEDQKAYDLGLNNTTTARDLLTILEAITTGRAGNAQDCEEMLAILKQQEFNEIIPRYLPDAVTVAHKTGSITALHHDAGIVYLPDGRSYVLVLLSRNLKDFDRGTEQLARVSEAVYGYMLQKRSAIRD